MSKSIKSTILASLGFVAAAIAIPQAFAAQEDIRDDPSYQTYARYHGFVPVERAADQGPAGRPAMEEKTRSGNIKDDPSYQAYLRYHGFHVESAMDRGPAGTPVVEAQTHSGSIKDDPSYQTYLRYHGFHVN